MMKHVIEVKNLTKVFGNLTAVDGISFEIDRGEVFGLLGPNGAGKTTTLFMLATLLKPTSGAAIINNYDTIKNPHQVRKSIGVVFQDPSSDDKLTGYENLWLHAMMYDVPKEIREERISEVLELVDLTDRKNDRVKKYSGGMRRRLEIARGLLHKPKILFLDEPTLGLDPQSREKIWEYIEKVVKEETVTIILTTHYMEEADRLCDKIAIIDFGKIVVLDNPKNLKKIIGGEIIKFKIKNPSIESVRRLSFVKEVKRLDDSVVVTVSNADKNLQQILKVIGKVESVELHAPTLNDVFLHYTGREIREESPEGGWFERVSNLRARR